MAPPLFNPRLLWGALAQVLTPDLAEEFITRRLQDDFVFSKEDWNQTTEARKILGVPGINRFLQIVAADPKFIISTPVLRQLATFRETGVPEFDPDKNLKKIEERAAVMKTLVEKMRPYIADNDFSVQDWKDLKPVREELIAKLNEGGLAAFNMLFWALRAAGGKVDKKVHAQLQKFVDNGYMNASVVAGLTVYESTAPAIVSPPPPTKSFDELFRETRTHLDDGIRAEREGDRRVRRRELRRAHAFYLKAIEEITKASEGVAEIGKMTLTARQKRRIDREAKIIETAQSRLALSLNKIVGEIKKKEAPSPDEAAEFALVNQFVTERVGPVIRGTCKDWFKRYPTEGETANSTGLMGKTLGFQIDIDADGKITAVTFTPPINAQLPLLDAALRGELMRLTPPRIGKEYSMPGPFQIVVK